MKDKMMKGSDQIKDSAKEDGDKISIPEAAAMWRKFYPETPVTNQTLRNWALKFSLGTKFSFLPRSRWILDRKKFLDFLNAPRRYLAVDKKNFKNS